MNGKGRRFALLMLLSFASVPAHAHKAESFAPWNFEPWIVFSLVLAAYAYFRGIRKLWSAAAPGRGIRHTQALAYTGGLLFLWVALITPLDFLGGVSFAAHMIQHEVLMLLAAPLLVLGRPLAPYLWALPMTARRNVGNWGKARWVRVTWRTLTHPFAAWTIHAIALWIWHAPLLFEAALRSEAAHTAQHLSFLVTALFFWWALLSRTEDASRVSAAVIYLFTTALHTSVLGALLTFSDSPWYPVYGEPPFGLTTLEDQQLGGLIMWVPGGVAYLVAALALFGVWLIRREHPASG